MRYLDPTEVHYFLTLPLSITWRHNFTYPQDLWKVLWLDELFYVKLEDTGNESSDISLRSFPICTWLPWNDSEDNALFEHSWCFWWCSYLWKKMFQMRDGLEQNEKGKWLSHFIMTKWDICLPFEDPRKPMEPGYTGNCCFNEKMDLVYRLKPKMVYTDQHIFV